ncbi:alkene reductase [Vibrio alginolyticus]|uniref:alkene reductase n=1 Tax=Vibrio TaxID=662 RepID=UPI0002D6A60B|nr:MULTISPECIES: alkene reductase [Vibrio]AVF76225.1 alkene reductase [Vibrio alginolyticus]EGQ7841443.1 alkene reductase [Vibrio alginolyticus]EGR0025320.1 alkene reductase [Vibrio alginolyticus]EJL6749707.1 alkene reductase [Vibrio alginolyticus]EJN3800825.1 alkene reductase [Vibrio alginolyticus]
MSNAVDLFSPIELGQLALDNRAIMAPLTRARAGADHIPNDLMVEYYAQRASAGLIIAECTMVMEGTSAFMAEPGIYNEEQIAAWKKVTDAVHERGGKIVLQIWHAGRACHPDLNEGKTPVAASALAIRDELVHTPSGKQAYTVPRALEVDEIASIVAAFKQGAENAKKAGFDGVEIHGANGYLIDNFLRDGSNLRTDEYGGSVENRARFLLEIVKEVVEVWGPGRVGLRTSPLNGFNDMKDSDPVGLVRYLAEQLNSFDLAYWHVMRADLKGVQKADVLKPARENYKGHLMANVGYSAQEAATAIAENKVDVVAFGVPFIANPDLVERFKKNAPLNEAKPEHFYLGGAEGYTDYPVMV